MRGVLGSANWLATESRPDLSVLVSLAQQGLPRPKLRHARLANQAVKRARQFKNLRIIFHPIPLETLRIVLHSDAALQNALNGHSQGSFLLGFTDKVWPRAFVLRTHHFAGNHIV